MSSQPIMVPGGERRTQSESHSVSVENPSEPFKSMTPPNVSRSLSNREYDLRSSYRFSYICRY